MPSPSSLPHSPRRNWRTLLLLGCLAASALACGSPGGGGEGQAGGGDKDSGPHDGDGDGDGDGDDPGKNPGDGDDGTDPDTDGGHIAICGNAKFEEGELCDDGNARDGDGCNATCTVIDPDYLCLNTGEPCTRVVTCGNGIIEGEEVCDDGEMPPKANDGCSANCKAIESGFSCVKPGQACVESPVCGNGVRERSEQCDDAQKPPADGDGCSATCQLEDAAAWFCPPGKPCVPVVCGDGVRTPGEECDDNQLPPKSGDGCSATCKLESGWRCGNSGCRAVCGDGLMRGGEECDDSNLLSGDGCSAACKQEPFYTCPATPGACISDIVCGDGCVDPGEICDPGNLSNDCGQADTSCTSVAQDAARACKGFVVITDPGVCGDGTVNLNEQCDPKCSGAAACNIPGCTACKIDAGWACPGPGNCFQIPACGDGVIQIGEQCDPGAVSHPGCPAPGCSVAPGYHCTGEPSNCIRPTCGNGQREGSEQCDDNNAANGDGCSSTCTVETGYVCPPGRRCQPICGDGVKQPSEQCDETSAGCVNCFIQPGYDCNVSGKSCALTVCGNGTKQRGEGCDDGNTIAGDGCSPSCQLEPTFTHDASGKPSNTAATCGDGFKTQSEDCDDGNTTSGDGCSSACKEESGWVCDENTITYPAAIDFRVTYRDFKSRSVAGGHPHFRNTESQLSPQTDRGIVGQLCSTTNYNATPAANTCGLLDADGKPRHMRALGRTIPDYSAAFSLWYRDSNPTNIAGANGAIQLQANPGLVATPGTPPTTPDVVRLGRVGQTSAYQLEDNAFFKLDGRGYGNTPGQSHNFNFTTELRYFFQYRGGEVLLFNGDDDVWVFINGRLAVDLGGIHGAHVGRVILGDENGSCNLQQETANTPAACTTYTAAEQTDTTDGRFAITKGEVYEIVLFHAERNPVASNFRLTLDGFLAPRSTCKTTCGDGIAAGNEICDTNSSLTSGYNTCLKDCSINFCGDTKVQGPNETCDAANKVTYQQTAGGCGFDCRPAPYCGDGIIQAFAGEVCDDGSPNNTGAYGRCASNCKSFGAYCGDGTKNGSEFCDSATKVAYQTAAGGCGFDCKQAPHCGDGVRNGDETCEPPNTTQCDSKCQITAYCGDGIKSPGEECDYGTFNAAPGSVDYGGCDTNCKQGPRCGDQVTQQSSGEECDDGAANAPASNPTYDSCTDACLLGPRCGDSIHQASREACDNGFNEDTYAYSPDACGPNCTAVPFCGDGVVESSVEQCDNGNANSDGAYDGCGKDCMWGPYCGDGSKNGSEECDDPNGNVGYSTDGKGCSFECKLNVPSCGDGVRNGPEQCDNGKEANNGAYGGCRADCTRAPRCGDKVLQAEHEECDDGPTGSISCTQSCKRPFILY